ncbi:VPLPA-CTERM sorting domain-containing protein [Gymnodinialimonas ulvae]|uniref:VPLPA-CTERM sorting domain-containing protein n=1 Tax=Gymnodinialimonas ulvae TaxID=3126504 RepID=UPI0030A259B9
MSTSLNNAGRFGMTTIAAAAMAMTFGTAQQAEATSVHWTNSGYSVSPSQRFIPSRTSLLSQFTTRGGSFSSSSSSSVSASASASSSASSSGGVITVIQTSTTGSGSVSASAGGSVSGSSSLAPVPLPAGGALLLAALGAFAAVRRRNTMA